MGKIESIVLTGAKLDFGNKKDLRLVFTNKAIRHIKEKYNGFQKAIRALDEESGDLNTDVLCDLIYAGLMVNKDSDITTAFVQTVIDDMPIYEIKALVQTHLVAAITGCYPDSKGGDSNTPQ